MQVLDKETLRHQLVTERNINKQLRHDIERLIDICSEFMDGNSAFDFTDQTGRDVDFCRMMIDDFNKINSQHSK